MIQRTVSTYVCGDFGYSVVRYTIALKPCEGPFRNLRELLRAPALYLYLLVRAPSVCSVLKSLSSLAPATRCYGEEKSLRANSGGWST